MFRKYVPAALFLIALTLVGVLWQVFLRTSPERLMAAVLSEMEKKPELVAQVALKGMKNIQVEQDERERMLQLEKIKKKRNEMLGDQGAPWAGNPQGDVTIFVFFDYHCGYCRRANAVIEKLLASDKNIKVVYKDYPIFGDYTFSKAALAAQKQGKYKDFYDVLMSSDGNFSLENILDIAKRLRLDMNKFTQDMNGQAVESQVRSNMALGNSLDINSTPTFVFGDTIVPGSVTLDQFKDAIAKERQKGQRPTAAA